METVAIFGVGLIGGSFALALRKAGFTGRIIGVSSDQTIRAALDRNVIDEALPARQAAGLADLLYLAQPIHKIADCLEELDAWVQPGALITDAGSTKKLIVQTANQKIIRARFLGGHPMAGRERRGVEAAEADLFQGRPYVLTPRSPEDLDHPYSARISRLDPAHRVISHYSGRGNHDQTVAFTSHLPQLASTALAALLEGRPERSNARVWAGLGGQHTPSPQFFRYLGRYFRYQPRSHSIGPGKLHRQTRRIPDCALNGPLDGYRLAITATRL